MEKNFVAEIEKIERDLLELKDAIASFTLDKASDQENAIESDLNDDSGKSPEHIILDRLHTMTSIDKFSDDSQGTGYVTYLGAYNFENHENTWEKSEVPTKDILEFATTQSAEKIFGCISNKERLHLLITLIKKPTSVSELMEECGYTSTGPLMFNLRALFNADLIMEDHSGSEKNILKIKNNRIKGLIMLLAGVMDLAE